MEPSDLAARHEAVARYDFRGVHPNLRFGTASDRYAGWLGQVYPEDRWAERVATRTKRLGGDTFQERTLPVESTADYFRHFSVVELDFTFYRPLADEDGGPTPNRFVLERYAEHAPDTARFLLKAPQAYTARTVRQSQEALDAAARTDESLAPKGRGPKGGRGRGNRPVYVPNPTYLDAKGFTERFLAPAVDVLGDRLAGVIFEQEYARVRESPPPEAFVGELDAFFADVPEAVGGRRVQAHLEIRSPHLLTEPYAAWLEARGLGFVFSHWTWLPPLAEQWALAGGRFTAANGEAVLRLLTPLRMPYEDAYALAHPFDAPAPELAAGAEAMVEDAADLARKAVDAGAVLNVIANNRAFGNAPALDQAVASRFLEHAERVPTDQ
ncbi:MAG TPA: DUF72 domain-containing protein [Rubricoccaceae bacterium]|nr:DUF72 domain-containing protein [Rubricoccaceae bacterium]